MSITSKLRRLAVILDELAVIDLGYPQGENMISPPGPEAIAVLTEAGLSGIEGLADLYSACDGISMPDVHIGYFIRPLQRVLRYDPTSDPLTILLKDEIPVLTLGSTGGDDLFVVERQDGRILYLPPGPLHGGRYDGRRTNVRTVAEGISHFLEMFIDDAEAFVRYDQGHRYLVDQG